MSQTKHLPRITIVTPSFNQGEYIEETIRSVILQNYPNLEYIIIDGGSTDNTVEIIKKYEAHIAYWISEPDKGQSDAINKGLKKATGELFNWLNSDDYYAPGTLDKVARAFSDPDVLCVCGRTRHFDEGGYENTGQESYVKGSTYEENITTPHINQPATFFRKKVVDELGPFDTDLHYLMDRSFWLKFLFRYGVKHIYAIEDELVHFRLHNLSKSGTTRTRFYNDYATMLFNMGVQKGMDQLCDFLEQRHEINKDFIFKYNMDDVPDKDVRRLILAFLLRIAPIITSKQEFRHARALYRTVDFAGLNLYDYQLERLNLLKKHLSYGSWFILRVVNKLKRIFGMDQSRNTIQITPFHVLATAWGYPTNHSKGNPFIIDQLKALSDRGIRTGVMLFEFISFYKYILFKLTGKKLHDYRQIPGIVCRVSFYRNLIPEFFKGPMASKLRKRLILRSAEHSMRRYIVKYGKPDVLHQHYILNGSAYIVAHLSRKFGIDYVLTEHSPMVTNMEVVKKRLGPYYSAEQLKAFTQNAAVRIAGCRAYCDIFEDVFDCAFTHVPCFVPDVFKDEEKVFSKKTKDHFTFITIGDLIQRKGQERLVRAFALAFKRDEDVHLTIAGPFGPATESVRKAIGELGLEDQVHLTGWLKREEVLRAIDASHAVVVSSDSETFNISLVEALFRGLPAVSTRCGGPEEIITPESGFLCDKTPEDLALKLRLLYNQYVAFDPNVIARQAVMRYAESRVIGQLIGLYKEAVKKDTGNEL